MRHLVNMAVGQFQYPHAGPFIFGKTAWVRELIWKKGAFSCNFWGARAPLTRKSYAETPPGGGGVKVRPLGRAAA